MDLRVVFALEEFDRSLATALGLAVLCLNNDSVGRSLFEAEVKGSSKSLLVSKGGSGLAKVKFFATPVWLKTYK